LVTQPVPESWEPIIAEHFDFLEDLEPAARQSFRDHLKLFVWEKSWIPAGGLEAVTDEMKVVIAGAAARISRGLPLDVWDELTEIIVYPHSYAHPGEDDTEVFGEAHDWGIVVLSWDAVEKGMSLDDDGHDTAVHEFAHVLDIADGWFDGTPVLARGADYGAWARVMGRHFSRLKHDPIHNLLRDYGATNEAEFFAVATEAFFEKPKKMRRKAPDLYALLSEYFQVDPAEHR